MDRSTRPFIARMLRLFSLPLVARELVQQAVRPQTYIIRTTYAIVLYLAALLWAIAAIQNTGAFTQLGEGAHLLELLVNLQFFGVYLFMPVLTCGVISMERERSTFDLLQLTSLGLTRILLEKLLSRLVPIGTFFLLTLPLLVFAFALGGVEVLDIGLALWFLALAAVQAGCLSLICSAYCRHTTSALIAAWVIELVFFGPWFWMGEPLLFPPGVYALAVAQSGGQALERSLPILGANLVGFLAARMVLELYQLSPEISQNSGRHLDWLRPRRTPGAAADLPGNEPVAWLERRRSLPDWGLRILWVVELLIVVVFALGDQDPPDAKAALFTGLLWCVWPFVILVVTVKGASLFATERSRQTLDVLLATPLTAQEIVCQKFTGVQRWVKFLSIPFLTVMVLSAGLRAKTGNFSLIVYLVCSLLNYVIYLPLCGWLSCWIGLHAKNQLRAVVKSLAVLVGWCVLPLLPAAAFGRIMFIVSPLAVLALNEAGLLSVLVAESPESGLDFVPVLFNSLFYWCCLAAIRNRCLKDAPAGLGRLNEREPAPSMARVP